MTDVSKTNDLESDPKFLDVLRDIRDQLNLQSAQIGKLHKLLVDSNKYTSETNRILDLWEDRRSGPLDELDDWIVHIAMIDDGCSVYLEDIELLNIRVNGEQRPNIAIGVFSRLQEVWQSQLLNDDKVGAPQTIEVVKKIYSMKALQLKAVIRNTGGPARIGWSISHKGKVVYQVKDQHLGDGREHARTFAICRAYQRDYLRRGEGWKILA
jgi:hypothetical protein